MGTLSSPYSLIFQWAKMSIYIPTANLSFLPVQGLENLLFPNPVSKSSLHLCLCLLSVTESSYLWQCGLTINYSALITTFIHSEGSLEEKIAAGKG